MNTIDAARAAGISYRQLDYWITSGYVRLADANPGSGVQRELPSSQVAILVRMADLVRGGVAPEAAAKLARDLRSKGAVRVGRFTITETGDVA